MENKIEQSGRLCDNKSGTEPEVYLYLPMPAIMLLKLHFPRTLYSSILKLFTQLL